MDKPTQRKPKPYFDTAANPSHVTFDDGLDDCCSLPWMSFVQARRARSEPNTIKIQIGDFVIVITGQNLAPLFLAIEDRTLTRVCAHPEFRQDRERESDTFATEIRFTKPPTKVVRARPGQSEFDLLE
ncbi:MAG: hypothetical protein ABIZ04_02455 [Opitutus sp.]